MSLCLCKRPACILATSSAFLPQRNGRFIYQQKICYGVSLQSSTSSSHPLMLFISAVYYIATARFEVVSSQWYPGPLSHSPTAAALILQHYQMKKMLRDDKKCLGQQAMGKASHAFTPLISVSTGMRTNFVPFPVNLLLRAHGPGSAPARNPLPTSCKWIHSVFNTTVN